LSFHSVLIIKESEQLNIDVEKSHINSGFNNF